jgi:hypothetical protein
LLLTTAAVNRIVRLSLATSSGVVEAAEDHAGQKTWAW